MKDDVKAYSLIQLGFNDYIASRHLINHKYILQGVTLASTAVEKYLKAILVSKGKTKKDIGVHLDKLDKLKKHLSECYTDFTNKIDERFLEILGKAYRARYYDDIKEPITIGFFVNQFLCELDYSIAFFENILYKDILDDKGNQVLTFYKRDVAAKNPDLISNNYLFSEMTKKDFMEQPDNGFCIYINPNRWNGNILVEGQNVKNTYDGRITLININFGNK
jgi:HEPN domain-containing protein